MKNIARIAGVTFLALAVVTPAQAYQCKSYPTQAVGIHKLKIKARLKARPGWSANVKGQFGLPWSVWKIAKSRSITCAKINTSEGPKWRCLASAKPCLYVVQ